MGKTEEKKEVHAEGVLQATGRNVDDLVRALVYAASDRNDAARHAVGVSLMEISRAEPALVITTCMDAVVSSQSGKGRKLEHGHRCALLRLIGKIVDDNRDVPRGIVDSMVAFAMTEMTATRDVVTDQQAPASAILVSMSIRGFGDPVLAALMGKLKSGEVPHYFVLKSLGDIGLATPLVLVPKLKDIMARLLPTLGQIKHAHVRYIFARSLGSMGEAVTLYLASEGAHEFRQEDFQSEFFTVNDMMFNRWLADKESEVRLATAHALARIGAVIDREQFEASVPRLVPGVLGLYRKTSKVEDLLILTKGLCKLFEVCNAGGSRVLEEQLPVILATIHPLACRDVNYEVSASAQFHAEVLRCFEILASEFADTLLNFCIERMTAKEPPLRVGTLGVLKHLITRSPGKIGPLSDLLVSGVRQMTAEPDAGVALALSELIMVMGHEGYLVHEGGQSLVQFLFRHASESLHMSSGGESSGSGSSSASGAGGTTASGAPGGGGRRKLRSSCERTIERLVADAPSMEDVFWPYALEFVVPRTFTAGLPVCLRVATALANRKREGGDASYFVDFAKNVNVPRPQAIIARLLVLLADPKISTGLAEGILKALLALGPMLSLPASKMWDQALPRLSAFLSAKHGTDAWDDDVWRELTHRLLRETVEAQSGEEEWLHGLAEDLASQFDLYTSASDALLKATVSLYLGNVLQRVTKKQLIRAQLDRMFAVCTHASSTDRTGCARGFGQTAASHMDICLEKLQHALKNDCVRKSSGFFGMVKDKSVQDVDLVTSTVILCLGHVTANAPAQMITTRVEVHVLTNALLPTLADAKTPVRKAAIASAVDLICRAVHPASLGTEFTLKSRDVLAQRLVSLVTSASETSMEIRTLGVTALATAAALPPCVPEDLEKAMIEAALKFIALPPSPGGDAEMDTLLENVSTLLASVLTANQTLDCLGRLLRALDPWLFSSKSALHRRRAVEVAASLLKRVIDLIGEGHFRAFEGRWKGLGVPLAAIVPRLADQDGAIRRGAFSCLELMLYIDFLLSSGAATDGGKGGGGGKREPPQALAQLHPLAARLLDDEVGTQVSTIWAFSVALASLLPSAEVPVLLETLLSRAQDSEIETVSAPIVVLNGVLQQCGGAMGGAVPGIVAGLMGNLAQARDDKNVNGLLRSFRTLASHHLEPVVDELLRLPLPHPPHVSKCISVLARGGALADGSGKQILSALLDRLLDLISHSKFTEGGAGSGISNSNSTEAGKGKGKGGSTSSPSASSSGGGSLNPIPIAATAALATVLSVDECRPECVARYPEILSHLLLRCGTSASASPSSGGGKRSGAPSAAGFARDALCAFLNQSGDGRCVALLDADGGRRWDLLSDASHYAEAVADIVTASVGRRPSRHAEVFEFVQRFVSGSNDRQRAVAVTVVAELLACCCAIEDIEEPRAENEGGEGGDADGDNANGGGDGGKLDDSTSAAAATHQDGDGGAESAGGASDVLPEDPDAGPHDPKSRPPIKRGEGPPDSDFVRQLLNTLLARQMDKDTPVKVQAMRGLGNIVFAGTVEVNRFSSHVLMALLHGVEDQSEDVALTSMNALAAIFEVVDQSNISGMLVNLALRVRPSFEVAHAKLRSAAHSLFATLCRFSHCDASAREAFGDQIHGNLVSVVLHARDEDTQVRAACQRALREIGVFMGVEAIQALFAEHADSAKDYYDDFLVALAELLVVHFAGNVNLYVQQCVDPQFKSRWPAVTANAVTLASSLLASSEPGGPSRVDAQALCKELIALLRSEAPAIRTKVSKGMSRLVQF